MMKHSRSSTRTHLVEDVQVDGGREEVFADAFDLVGERLGDAPVLDEVVVERADRVDADHLDAGFFSLRYLPTCR
jgi:hypothetical protein